MNVRIHTPEDNWQSPAFNSVFSSPDQPDDGRIRGITIGGFEKTHIIVQPGDAEGYQQVRQRLIDTGHIVVVAAEGAIN